MWAAQIILMADAIPKVETTAECGPLKNLPVELRVSGYVQSFKPCSTVDHVFLGYYLAYFTYSYSQLPCTKLSKHFVLVGAIHQWLIFSYVMERGHFSFSLVNFHLAYNWTDTDVYFVGMWIWYGVVWTTMDDKESTAGAVLQGCASTTLTKLRLSPSCQMVYDHRIICRKVYLPTLKIHLWNLSRVIATSWTSFGFLFIRFQNSVLPTHLVGLELILRRTFSLFSKQSILWERQIVMRWTLQRHRLQVGQLYRNHRLSV
jgi:hypothetical protein